MLSSRDPSRIVPLPSPVSRPYDLLCVVLYGAQNQTLPETPPLAAPRITVVGSYATGLTMKVQRLPSTEADFRDVLSGWLFWAFAQHRSASASAVFAARIASSTPSSRDSIWNGKPAPSTYLHKLLDVTEINASGQSMCCCPSLIITEYGYSCGIIYGGACSIRAGDWARSTCPASDCHEDFL